MHIHGSLCIFISPDVSLLVLINLYAFLRVLMGLYGFLLGPYKSIGSNRS